MCGVPAPLKNPRKRRRRDHLSTNNTNPDTTPEQISIYLDPLTYRTDNGNFSLGDIPANETAGLPPLALAELRAMGLNLSVGLTPATSSEIAAVALNSSQPLNLTTGEQCILVGAEAANNAINSGLI